MSNNKLKYALCMIGLTTLLQACHDYAAQQQVKRHHRQVAQAVNLCQNNEGKTANDYALSGQSSHDGWQYYQHYCAQYGISLDQQLWQKGYTQGNTTYCTLLQAYESGKNHHSFNRYMCKSLTSNALNARIDANRYGFNIANQQQSIKKLEDAADQIRSQIRTTERQLENVEQSQQQSHLRQQQKDLMQIQHQINMRQTTLMQMDLNYRNKLILKGQSK